MIESIFVLFVFFTFGFFLPIYVPVKILKKILKLIK